MRGSFITLALGIAGLWAAPGIAQDGGRDAPPPKQHSYVSPYIELGQVVTADLTDDDVLTYSEVAVGVDAGLSTRTSEAQVSYRYERNISWDKHVGDDDIHEGLARAAIGVTPALSVEGGAIATRARYDIRGAAPVVLAGNVDNVTQIYAAYAGPTLGTHVGPVGVSASYRYGYTKVEAPGFTGVPAGQPKLDNYDDSSAHVVQGSLNLKSGEVLPVGVTVSGAWEREDAHQLDQRYEGKYVRGDVVVPVSRTLALEGGVGYEKIEISQRDAKVDANGAPVIDANGRFVTDPTSPRRLAYRTDGLIYDAGVLWRPSPRTELEAHVGRRYGSTSYAGRFSWQASRSVGAHLIVYDEVDTFARQLRHGLEGIPTSFLSGTDVFGDQFNGCVFGTSGAAAGGCFNGIFQSISSASYRARGVDAVIVASRGPLRTGFGVGYANRHFFAPTVSTGFTINGVEDQSWYAEAFADRALDSRSSLQGNLYVNYYDSGIPGAAGVYGTGATGAYNRRFGHIDAVASVGLYAFGSKDSDDDVAAQALLGMRYQF